MDDQNIEENGLEDIAIIGMAGRFPGANNIDEFWNNLCEGIESVRSFDEEELLSAGIEPQLYTDPSYVNAGAPLEYADEFDANFFGINQREAELMDPQHRIMLECAWGALENAGYNPIDSKGTVGVFGGIAINSYFRNNLINRKDIIDSVGYYPALLSIEKEFSVLRISYKLDLKGPSVFTNTACSTSGVAIHLACQSILSGECQMALAGGCRIKVPLTAGYLYQDDGILSPDGKCCAFSADAKGTVVGSGCGMIVLKALTDAMKDQDTIYSIIKGTAINNDGAAKVGFTAPSVNGQAELIEEALAVAGVSADQIGYVEAHGTGTVLGDPIEISALTKAYHKNNNLKQYCGIGSLKTNVGHLDAAAGVAGVIKASLSLKNCKIPPSINFDKPNPQIDFENSPFFVVDKLSDWKAANGHPRLAAVSSFGLGGTNAHLILQEALFDRPSCLGKPYQLLTLSAKTERSLESYTQNLSNFLEKQTELNLSDAAYTLQLGRHEFSHRKFMVCHDLDDAISTLKSNNPNQVFSNVLKENERPLVFMFSGQGTQYVNMGYELYLHFPKFREQLDRCEEILESQDGIDIRSFLFPEENNLESIKHNINQTEIAQPILFVLEYSLARLLISMGLKPKAMIGHSIGEYVAACLSGVLTLEDALSLVVARGKLMSELPEGSMLAVLLSEHQLERYLNKQLSLAAVNSPKQCVVSGPTDLIDHLHDQLQTDGVSCRYLHTSHAFHSNMMQPIVSAFIEKVKGVELNPPKIPYISNVSGTWITDNDATDPNYWANHILQPVRFSDGIQNLIKEFDPILVEVGAGQTLCTLAHRNIEKNSKHAVVSTLPSAKANTSDVAYLLKSIGQLWLLGMGIEWIQLYANESRYRIALPTYPFDRKRYWVEPVKTTGGIEGKSALRIPINKPKLVEINKKINGGSDKNSSTHRENLIIDEIANIIHDIIGIEPEKLDIKTNFTRLGIRFTFTDPS